MAFIKSLNSSQTALCGSIYVEDQSVYGIASPDTREDWGIALFVGIDAGSGSFANDPTLSNLINPGAIGIPATWDIDIPNSKTQAYKVSAFWCPLWISGAYAENQVVYYDGFFYVKNTTGTGTELPSIGGEWILLTEDDFDIFEAALLLNITNDVVYESVIGCPKFKVVFKECDHVQRVVDNSENNNNKRFSVTRYDGTPVLEEVKFEGAKYIDFTLPEDHVYIITIEEEVGFELWEEVAKLPIYEYCSLKKCSTYLMNSLMCNEFDPCCENCDNEAIAKKTKQRLQLNQLFFLSASLMSYIHEESIEYLGLIDMSADRLTYMERIDNLFDKIKMILERCDLCAGAWQVLATPSTNQGSYKPCNC